MRQHLSKFCYRVICISRKSCVDQHLRVSKDNFSTRKVVMALLNMSRTWTAKSADVGIHSCYPRNSVCMTWILWRFSSPTSKQYIYNLQFFSYWRPQPLDRQLLNQSSRQRTSAARRAAQITTFVMGSRWNSSALRFGSDPIRVLETLPLLIRCLEPFFNIPNEALVFRVYAP